MDLRTSIGHTFHLCSRFSRNHQRRINSSQLVRNVSGSGTQEGVAATPSGPPEQGTEHPVGSAIRLSTQERIRRAFVLRGRPGSPAQAPIMQQQDIVSSEVGVLCTAKNMIPCLEAFRVHLEPSLDNIHYTPFTVLFSIFENRPSATFEEIFLILI